MIDEMINYTAVADKVLITSLIDADNNLPEADRLISHILNAQHIWAHRILNQPNEFEPWQIHIKAQFLSISVDNIQGLKQILATRTLDELIIYHNTAGKAFENSIGQILYHVCNHSTYHRAQVAAILKAHHIVPPITDYIILKRNHLV